MQNGKSEVRSFIYKHLPVPVTGLKHTINERNRQATVTWNAAEGHTKYYVEYYNPQTTKTIAMEKDEPKFTLASAPEKEYTILFRVKAQCWGDDSRCSNWSDWDTIKYAAPQIVEPKYPCGYQFPKVEITNFELKTDFKEDDIVSEANGSSDYEIINCKSDGDGVLQGQFYLIMNAWGGAKIACEFWDTKINTDNQIITTRYRSIDTPVGMVEPEELANYVKSLWLDGNSLATSSKIRDTIVIDQKFDYLYRRESGEFVAVVVNSDGSTTETEFDLHKNPSQTLITDGKGDSLVYSQNGQVMGIKEYRATGGNAALLKDYHRKSDSIAQWQINFLPDTATQIYGFDYLGSGNHGIYSGTEYYPSVNGYDFRYKSVETSNSDKVIVDFGSYPEKDSVIFKDKYGVTLKLSKGNILNFTGVAKPDTNYIYAYRGDQKIGKLFLNTYQQKTYKVVLISVNEATLPNTTDLENYLNKVYNQCAVSFKIETRKLQVSGIENFTHGGTKVAGSVWNASQKAVLEAFGEKFEDNTAYLFFIPKAETNGVAGYMPRYYPYGFIYPGAANRTIAHELGHGIAGLEHPFPESQVSGSTQNLMDYRDGEELWHFQWDMLQDPARKIFKWWQNEQGAESVKDDEPIITKLHWYTLNSDKEGLFVKPNGKLIWLSLKANSQVFIMQKTESAGIANLENRALFGFVMNDNQDTILAEFDGDSFVRYYYKNNGDTYNDNSFEHITVNSFNNVYIWNILNETIISKNWIVTEDDKAVCIYDKKNKQILVVSDIRFGLSWMNISNNEPINVFEIDDINIVCFSEQELINSDYNPVLKAVYLADNKFFGSIIGLINYYPQKVVDNVTELIDNIAVHMLVSVAEQIDPQVSNYDESEKQLYFSSDANKTVAILLYEFATGTGEPIRVFSDSSINSFASVYLEGRIIEEIYNDFYNIMSNRSFEDFEKNGVKINLEFSPDQTDFWKSIEKHFDSNLPQFFIGGSTAFISTTDKEGSVLVEITNKTSRNSLMLHMVNNYDRVDGKIIPLSTITQKIIFNLSIDESKIIRR